MTQHSLITLASDIQNGYHQAVYIAWNGGTGKVAAFLNETKRRMTNKPLCLTGELADGIENQTAQVFYKTLSDVANEYYDFISPSHSGQVSIKTFKVDKYPASCKYYSVDDNLASYHIDTVIFSDKEETDYEQLTKFFNLNVGA